MNLQNHFLIAMPTLHDPCFKHSVIYICEHNNEGAMGLIINKPLEHFTVESVLNKLKIPSTPDNLSVDLKKPLFFGGPLADDRGFILHTPCQTFSASIQVSSETILTTSKDVLETLGTPDQPEQLILALGYASWDKGQLEDEIMSNSWLTAQASREILFHTPVAHRWQEAASQLGIDIRRIANYSGHA